MLRTVLAYGVIAGLIVIVPMGVMLSLGDFGDTSHSQLTGYTIMLLAFSLIFFGVKRHRDRALGGVIRFLPALLAGLGISAVAGAIYVVGWEITLAATDYRFMDEYAAAMLAQARDKGASAAELARITADMASMKTLYANPLFRMPMTFVEIFPVGVLVSIITAALLRNSRFLPMKVERAL